MHLPRRHRRRLFFPAGLLALAWLLPLGCGLIAAQTRPRLQSVLEVYTPAFVSPGNEEERYALEHELIVAAQPDSAYYWHTIQLTGNPWQDDLNNLAARFTARQLQLHPAQRQGIRLVFGPATRYRQLVAMLDLFGTENLSRHWLDARHKHLILSGYAVPETSTLMPCGTSRHLSAD